MPDFSFDNGDAPHFTEDQELSLHDRSMRRKHRWDISNQNKRSRRLRSVGGKVAPRVCVVDGKPHNQKFLGDALEEAGFIICKCTQFGELSVVLDVQAPDLIVVGLSVGGIEAAAMLEALAARVFDGKVLLLGPRDC